MPNIRIYGILGEFILIYFLIYLIYFQYIFGILIYFNIWLFLLSKLASEKDNKNRLFLFFTFLFV